MSDLNKPHLKKVQFQILAFFSERLQSCAGCTGSVEREGLFATAERREGARAVPKRAAGTAAATLSAWTAPTRVANRREGTYW